MGLRDLPVASGHQHERVFAMFGWTRARENNHIIMTKPGARATLSIPNHREVKRQVLAKLLAAAGITIDEYIAAFSDKKKR